MATDPTQMQLTDEQKQRLAELAEREGKDYSQVLNERLTVPLHGEESGNGASSPQNLFEALDAIGAIGCFEGPGDLSTNPKHMEGFGINASRRRDSD